MKSLQRRFLELILFLQNCILCKHSCCCAFEEMGSIAKKMTSNVTYIGREICNIDENWTGDYQQRCLEKIQCYKNTLTTWKKNMDKIDNGVVVQWLSLLHNFIQLSLNSGSAQVQILLAACWRFVMVRISDNGPGWK